MAAQMSSMAMSTGRHVEHAESGAGAPVLLIHGGVFADWFVPLMSEVALQSRRLVRVRRAGYAVSAALPTGVTIVDHTDDVAAVADRLGVRDALVVGHSSGALVALELAMARPDIVRELLLVEPAPGGGLVTPEGAAMRNGLEQMVLGVDGDVGRYDTFMSIVCAPDHRDVVTAALGPEALDRTIAESRYFFADELAQVGAWDFDQQRAASIGQPTTLVVGSASPPPVHDVIQRLHSWLDDVGIETVEGGDHLLPLRRPDVLAALIASRTPS
jgi:pimeloyl-ACP methyl ester carboxylesterase